jgi:hypothetical protein
VWLTYYNQNKWIRKQDKSVNDWKDVIVNVITSSSIRTNVENLGKSELFGTIHAEIATHKHNYTSWKSAILDIRSHISIFDVFEAKGLNFFWDVFESNKSRASVGHLTSILVEINQALSVLTRLLHSFVVLFKEKVGNLFWIHSRIIYKLMAVINKGLLS